MCSSDLELLLGQDHNWLMPAEIRRAGNFTLYRSLLKGKSMLTVAGSPEIMRTKIVSVNTVRTSHVVPPEFLDAEALGTDLPRKCGACKNCKECKYKTTLLSFQESAELDIIMDNLSYCKESKKWTASYPFHTDPSVLQDNLKQAVACMKKQEKRLRNQGILDKYNQEFHSIVQRGVFKELTKEEHDQWKGPVN